MRVVQRRISQQVGKILPESAPWGHQSLDERLNVHNVLVYLLDGDRSPQYIEQEEDLSGRTIRVRYTPEGWVEGSSWLEEYAVRLAFNAFAENIDKLVDPLIEKGSLSVANTLAASFSPLFLRAKLYWLNH